MYYTVQNVSYKNGYHYWSRKIFISAGHLSKEYIILCIVATTMPGLDMCVQILFLNKTRGGRRISSLHRTFHERSPPILDYWTTFRGKYGNINIIRRGLFILAFYWQQWICYVVNVLKICIWLNWCQRIWPWKKKSLKVLGMDELNYYQNGGSHLNMILVLFL